jgi:signal-transduction protein with cAMP-binding, CBS, and nucleotidyltransferase domain
MRTNTELYPVRIRSNTDARQKRLSLGSMVSKEESGMNIRQLCKPNPVTVRAIDDLNSAAEAMREKHVGYLVVVEPGPEDQTFKPVGVLTDRDIVVAVVARGIDPRTCTSDGAPRNRAAADAPDGRAPYAGRGISRRAPGRAVDR